MGMADYFLPSRRAVLAALGAAPLAAALPREARAGASPDFEGRIQEILQRPPFLGAAWGVRFLSLRTGTAVYSLNPDQRFQAASSLKVFIAGTAFHALGADYRFRTGVYGTGQLTGGVLRGDLVLVAGGDLLLGGRVRHDGTLSLPDPDHTYGTSPGAAPLPGDPLGTLRELACRVKARGIKRIEGRVLVDASLFREGRESIANGGIMVTVSPMMVNDNVIDIEVRPGRQAGDPAVLRVSPRTGYVRIRNEVVTVEGPAAQPLALTEDGTLTGQIALGQALFRAYYVPSPVRFAEAAFTDVLRDSGIRVDERPLEARGRTHLTEHVSLPLPDESKVMLKVSSNVHTVMFPYVIGAIAGRDPENPKAAYNALRRELFVRAGLEADPPGAAEGLYTPSEFTRFLAHLAQQPYFASFREALPILGRDGTLEKVQAGSPAAGHVYAKTGTGLMLAPGGKPLVHKALAGYVHLPSGGWLSFGAFMRKEADSPPAAMELATLAGEALGEITTAAYLGLEA
jgi:D-alanyl-D-alanine carboxypeptidase/D-alanyl-D-alanine-endopeptidase (penicillin-binding protein 4)